MQVFDAPTSVPMFLVSNTSVLKVYFTLQKRKKNGTSTSSGMAQPEPEPDPDLDPDPQRNRMRIQTLQRGSYICARMID